MTDNPTLGNLTAGKFGGKYAPQAQLAVLAQDPEIDGFIMVVSRRNPDHPFELLIVDLDPETCGTCERVIRLQVDEMFKPGFNPQEAA